MRRVATFEKQEDATAIFIYLQQIDIECQMDEGDEGFEIWIKKEDKILIVKQIIDDYKEKGAAALTSTQKPEAQNVGWRQSSRIEEEGSISGGIEGKSSKEEQEKGESEENEDEPEEDNDGDADEDSNADGKKSYGGGQANGQSPFERVVLSEADPPAKVSFFGPITRLIVITCAVFFFISTYQTSALVKSKKIEATLPVLAPINQLLLFDYPPVLRAIEELVDLELAKRAAVDQSQEQAKGQGNKSGADLDADIDADINEESVQKAPQSQTVPTPREKELIEKIETTPLWVGFYKVLLHYDKRDVLLSAPLFTSILHGEVWRLITPIFLHAGILHFIFNMLWLWLLGKMVEGNMPIVSYIVFILIAAAVTNTLQYLMTGPFFMGISGVLTAMAGYIWSRKKVAPWEIYPVDRGTLLFLGCFIFGLLGLQIVSFFLQIFYNSGIPLNFANTAHISGVFFGLIVGRTKLFQKRRA